MYSDDLLRGNNVVSDLRQLCVISFSNSERCACSRRSDGSVPLRGTGRHNKAIITHTPYDEDQVALDHKLHWYTLSYITKNRVF